MSYSRSLPEGVGLRKLSGALNQKRVVADLQMAHLPKITSSFEFSVLTLTVPGLRLQKVKNTGSSTDLVGAEGRARARKRVYGPSVGVKTCSRKCLKVRMRLCIRL
jgi:hypothetical protein